jgi:hypothetical protein
VFRVGDRVVSTMFGWEGKLPGLIISYDYPPPDVYESSVRMWEVLLDEELHHDGLVIGTERLMSTTWSIKSPTMFR